MANSSPIVSLLALLIGLSTLPQPCESYTTLGPGMQVRLRPVNLDWRYLRHQFSNISIDEPDASNPGLFEADSTWVVIPGLAGVGISFRSQNYPNEFLRHEGFDCVIAPFENTDLYKADASWIVSAPLFDQTTDENRVSLRAANFPGQYMRHAGFNVRVDQQEYLPPYMEDATWIVDTLESPDLSGNWQLLWSYDNTESPNDYHKKWTMTHGIVEMDSITKNSAWGVSITAEAAYSGFTFSASISTTAEYSQFVEETQSSEYSYEISEESEITVAAGTAAFMWQWTMTAGSANIFTLTNDFPNSKITQNNTRPTEVP